MVKGKVEFGKNYFVITVSCKEERAPDSITKFG